MDKDALMVEGAECETNTESTLGAVGGVSLPVRTLVRSWAAQFMDSIRAVGKLLVPLRLKSALTDYATIPLHFTLLVFFF